MSMVYNIPTLQAAKWLAVSNMTKILILRIIVQSNHYKYMVLIKVIAIDLFSVVKCEKSCSD